MTKPLLARLVATCFLVLATVGAQPVLPGPPPGTGIASTSMSDDTPPFHEEDYAPYFKGGTSSLVVRPTFATSDASKQECGGHFDRAYLYPGTAYTRWIIENWIFQLQKAKEMTFATAHPGAYVRSLPEYLNRVRDDTIVREAPCDAAHEFVFDRLPVGYYLLFIERDHLVPSTREKVVGVQVMTPEGPTFELQSGGVFNDSYFSDSNLYYGEFTVHIDASGSKYTIDSKKIVEVAHYAQ